MRIPFKALVVLFTITWVCSILHAQQPRNNKPYGNVFSASYAYNGNHNVGIFFGRWWLTNTSYKNDRNIGLIGFERTTFQQLNFYSLTARVTEGEKIFGGMDWSLQTNF